MKKTIKTASVDKHVRKVNMYTYIATAILGAGTIWIYYKLYKIIEG